MTNKTALRFLYRNYKDEVAERTVYPDHFPNKRLSYREPYKGDQYHPDGGWLLSGICMTQKARRSFELKRIMSPITEVLVDELELIAIYNSHTPGVLK